MKARPYRGLVGALARLALGTRPLSLSLPHCLHASVTIRVVLIGRQPSASYITLGARSSGVLQLAVFTDADWGSHRDDRRLVGAYLIKIGDGVVSWKSKKQSCVALWSTEAEYMVLCQASKESVWMVDFLKDLGVSMQGPVVVNADNQGSIALSKNPCSTIARSISTYHTTMRGN